jgi:uncharacterized membrane protein HdeD (DUF308 family)
MPVEQRSHMLGTVGGWFISLGVVLVVGGVVALSYPRYTGIGLAVMIGWILVLSAVMYGISGWTALKVGRAMAQLVLALLYAAAGVYLVLNPGRGLMFLGWLLGVLFFLEGILKLAFAAGARALPGRSWLLFTGLVSALLGVLILARWPISSTFVVGLFTGLNLMFGGWAAISVGAAMRAAASRES